MAEAEICYNLKGDAEIVAFLSETEALMTTFALEFGEKCGIFSTIDSILDAAKDFVEPLEQAMKQITDALSKLYREVQKVVDQLVGLVEEGLTLLKEFLVLAAAAVTAAVATVNALIDGLGSLIAQATNALASALCNTLNSALTGLPSDVVLKSPGLIAATLYDRSDPVQFLKQAMSEGANQIKGDIINAVAEIDRFTSPPNLRKYTCRPL